MHRLIVVMSKYDLSDPQAKFWTRLEQNLGSITAEYEGHLAIAYSGGLDSRFLAHSAKQMGFLPELFHVKGPHVPGGESQYPRDWARARGLPYHEVVYDPLRIPAVAAGSRNRCYACKKGLFSALLSETDFPLCDGTNTSDMGQYRPGIRALRELGIYSPLADSGLSKSMIHDCAALTGLENPGQRPHPCLLTRLPYDTSPEHDVLQLIEAGEEAIRRSWSEAGWGDPDFRLRLVSGRLELHIASENWQHLSPELNERFLACLTRLAPLFPSPCVRRVEKLSGFFDQNPSS